MALFNNNGNGYKTVDKLVDAILRKTNAFSRTELRAMVRDMRANGWTFNDRDNGNVTVIICNKGTNYGYYFGLEGIEC